MFVKVVAVFKLVISIHLSNCKKKTAKKISRSGKTAKDSSGLLPGGSRKFDRKFHQSGADYPPPQIKSAKDQKL